MLRIRQFKTYLFLLLFVACAYSQSTGSIYGTKSPPGGSVTKKDGTGSLFILDIIPPAGPGIFFADTVGTDSDSGQVTVGEYATDTDSTRLIADTVQIANPTFTTVGNIADTSVADSINTWRFYHGLAGRDFVYIYLVIKDLAGNITVDSTAIYTIKVDVDPPVMATFTAELALPYDVTLNIAPSDSTDAHALVYAKMFNNGLSDDSISVYEGNDDTTNINLSNVLFIAGNDSVEWKCWWVDAAQNRSAVVIDTTIPPDSVWNFYAISDTPATVFDYINFLFSLDSSGNIVSDEYIVQGSDSVLGSYGDTTLYSLLDIIYDNLGDTAWVATIVTINDSLQDTSAWIQPTFSPPSSGGDTLIADNFNRASLGPDWTINEGSASIINNSYCRVGGVKTHLNYTADSLTSANGWIRVEVDNYSNYQGITFRSTNDANGYLYAVRWYSGTTTAWRYCDDNTATCTDIETGSLNFTDGDYIQVEWTGTSTSTEVKIWNLGTSPAARGSEGAADLTFTNNPGQEANTGKVIGLYSGSTSGGDFDNLSAGDL